MYQTLRCGNAWWIGADRVVCTCGPCFPTGRLRIWTGPDNLAIERARADADRDEVVARLRGAVASSGLTNAEFAERVGTSASRLSTYLNGKVTPSAAMLVRIERAAATTI